MGYDVGKGKKRPCHCYILSGEKLLCYAPGTIGTLSDNQVNDLCIQSKEDLLDTADEPSEEMEESYKSFTEALEAASDEYDDYRDDNLPSVKEWYKILSEHMRKK